MESNDKDIRQLFQEIKIADQEITPSFEETFRMASQNRSNWRRNLQKAAAVILIIGLGLSNYVFQSDQTTEIGNQPISISDWYSPLDHAIFDSETHSISTWKSPTDFSSIFSSPGNVDLNSWHSPTDFLLQMSH